MIRKVKNEDLQTIKDLMQSIPYFWHECWNDEILEKACSSASALPFVYEENGEILGVIFAYDFGFRGYIAKLATAEKARGRGIGKSLIKHVENILRENGCELIITDVLESAESFYKELGFDYPKAILLRKRLMN